MILGLIPARGGSKRLPNKNIRLFHGRPLIAWTILEAKKSAYLDAVAVTTESSQIAEIAFDYGCDVIKRPILLAGDKSIVYDTIRHTIGLFPQYDAICLLQPTSPLRIAEDIDNCISTSGEFNWHTVSATDGETEPNGAVYVASIKWLQNRGNWDDGSSLISTMPKNRSIDINTIEDFELAERLMKERSNEPV